MTVDRVTVGLLTVGLLLFALTMWALIKIEDDCTARGGVLVQGIVKNTYACVAAPPLPERP